MSDAKFSVIAVKQRKGKTVSTSGERTDFKPLNFSVSESLRAPY